MGIHAGDESRPDADHERRIRDFGTGLLFLHRGVHQDVRNDGLADSRFRVDEQWNLALSPYGLRLDRTVYLYGRHIFDALDVFVSGLGKCHGSPHGCGLVDLRHQHPHVTLVQAMRDAASHLPATPNQHRKIHRRSATLPSIITSECSY